jgi:glycosyltransferase involved in cell wall biosynthesis
MRVLYASARSAFPLLFSGGAWRSAHELLLALTRQGVTCGAAAADPDAVASGAERTFDCGYPVTVYDDLFRSLDDVLAAFRPDVVCSHLDRAIEVLRRAARAGARPAWFIRNAECVDHPQPHLDEAHELGARLYASSPFLARHIEESHRIPAVCLFSAVDVDRYRVPLDPGGAITMVNPAPVKGLLTLIGLVLRLPHRPFLVVEGWRGDGVAWPEIERLFGPLPNVRLVRAVRDMREVYRQTRVLIVPSRWQEGFGRVAAEAHASGIPVIASRVGGLADFTAGTLLVDDFTDPDPWADAVERLCADETLFLRLSAEARRHSQTAPYRAEQVAARFLSDLAEGPSTR